jgi:predicted nucleic acid-binding protein
MSDRRFVDTNILIYAHDTSAAARHERARDLLSELWEDGSGTLSTQVLQELAVNLRRKVPKPLGARQIREIVSDYLTWHVVVNTPDSVLAALDLQERYRISFWDAMIVHAANVSGAMILYSEDLSDNQVYGSIRVENPFREQTADR